MEEGERKVTEEEVSYANAIELVIDVGSVKLNIKEKEEEEKPDEKGKEKILLKNIF